MNAKTTKSNLTEEEARFIAESTAAVEEARKHVAKHGIPPQFLTKRWREKTSFPIEGRSVAARIAGLPRPENCL